MSGAATTASSATGLGRDFLMSRREALRVFAAHIALVAAGCDKPHQ